MIKSSVDPMKLASPTFIHVTVLLHQQLEVDPTFWTSGSFYSYEVDEGLD